LSYSAAALVGGDLRIPAWHQIALKEALDAGEEYAQARLGGNHGSLTTGNWTAACFLHDTARPVSGQAPNPHLHSHVVVFNMTHTGDKVRSVQAAEWYRIQSYMSAIYQASMANQALAGGYELEHGKNFSTRIKGFSDEYLDAMSARTKEIEAEKDAKGLSGAEADLFEGAVDELGMALGFATQRPDKEWKEGPDNLWGLRDTQYLLIECKNQVEETRTQIHKQETGQMNNSCAWFKNNYSGAVSKNIMIIWTKAVASAAGFNEDVGIMRGRQLETLVKNVRSFFQEFRGVDLKDLSETKVKTLLDTHQLTVDDLLTKYSEAPQQH
jgi:hypothetical protein